MTLARQFHLANRHPLVVAGEGAFFAWLVLARQGSTWVMVHNHSHHPIKGTTRTSNFHAKLVHEFSWVRLVVYVIDNGRRENMTELLRVLRDVPWTGGDVIHVGALADSSSKYKNDPWIESRTPEHQTLAYVARHQLPMVLVSEHGRRPMIVLPLTDGRRLAALHVSGEKANGTDFLLRNSSSGNFELVVYADRELVLSIDNSPDVVACSRPCGTGSTPVVVETRASYPTVALGGLGRNVFLRASPSGVVDTVTEVRQWETWTLVHSVNTVAELAKRRAAFVLCSAHDSRPLVAPRGVAASLHSASKAGAGTQFVLSRGGDSDDATALLLALSNNESLVLSLLGSGTTVGVCQRGAAGCEPLFVTSVESDSPTVALGLIGNTAFLSANPEGVVGTASLINSWEKWTLVLGGSRRQGWSSYRA
jgi:hypothetical protein